MRKAFAGEVTEEKSIVPPLQNVSILRHDLLEAEQKRLLPVIGQDRICPGQFHGGQLERTQRKRRQICGRRFYPETPERPDYFIQAGFDGKVYRCGIERLLEGFTESDLPPIPAVVVSGGPGDAVKFVGRGQIEKPVAEFKPIERRKIDEGLRERTRVGSVP